MRKKIIFLLKTYPNYIVVTYREFALKERILVYKSLLQKEKSGRSGEKAIREATSKLLYIYVQVSQQNPSLCIY